MSIKNDARHRKSGASNGELKNEELVEPANHDQKRRNSSKTEKFNNNYEPFHQVRDSLLSSASGYTNYRGFLNLCVVLLVMSTGRLVLENIIKYGFLVRFDIPILFIKDPTAWPSLLAIVLTNVFILLALKIEKKLEHREITENRGDLFCFLNVTLALLLPAVYLWYREANPVSSFFALATYTCLSMKLVSYYQVNKYYRMKKQKEQADEVDSAKSDTSLSDSVNESMSQDELVKPKEDYNDKFVAYPQNLTLKNIYYFMAVPTLCYEIHFPRTHRIRKSFIIRRMCEIVFLSALQFILIQQWIVPILRNSKIPFRETNIPKIIERLLKLAVPNHVIWLIAFYCFFHSYLNVLAEILRFGDREFYRDWWNSTNVSLFWQNWNIPVHNFCSRHIYKPLLAQGVTKLQASLIVFFISAFFHEYLVSIPLRMFRLWSFFGMILQIPFAIIVKKFLHGNYGNMAVWISLIIGQPIAIMMYIHDFYIDYFSKTN